MEQRESAIWRPEDGPQHQLCSFFSIKHDLARSCFKFWLKIGDEGDKISRKKTGEALAETVFSRNFVTLGADFEGHNWKHDLARLCFMLYTPSYGNSQLKMEILEFTNKEAAAPLMSVAVPLWFWKFWEKISFSPKKSLKLRVYNIQHNLARSCFPLEYFCFVKILFLSFKFFPLPGYPNVSMPLPLRKDDYRFPKPHYWNFFDSAPEPPPGNECELIVKRNCL